MKIQHSVMLSCLLVIGALAAPGPQRGETPAFEWERWFPGSSSAFGSGVRQTIDGGYVVVGETSSGALISSSALYVLKTTGLGTPQWERTFRVGGIECYHGRSVVEARDGSYVIAGFTDSCDSQDGDAYLLKVNAYGDLVWQKSFGGDGAEYAISVEETHDGGYILAGHAFGSNRVDVSVYLVRTNSDGVSTWENRIGQASGGTCVRESNDKGLIVGGVNNGHVYLLKTDRSGNLEWDRNYGGDGAGVATAVDRTRDGGYIVVGWLEGVPGVRGSEDIYLVNTNEMGEVVWEKRLGSERTDIGNAVQETRDGGYIIGGQVGGLGAGDGYVAKVDASGGLSWEKRFAQDGVGFANSVWQSSDGGWVIAGGGRLFEEPRIKLYLGKLLPDNEHGDRFIRGDANSDSDVNLADAVYLLNYLFLEGSKPRCEDAIDVDDGGDTDIGDALFLLNYLLGNGPMLPQPFPQEGEDPTRDDLMPCRKSSS